MATTIVGRNGAQVQQTTKVAIVGCPHIFKKHRKQKKHGKPAKRQGRKASHRR